MSKWSGRTAAPRCTDSSSDRLKTTCTSVSYTHLDVYKRQVSRCRELLGPEAIVGLSTHSTIEFDEALNQSATYFSAGPIVATPTKPGRTGTGVNYAIASQARSDRPVFVTGGVNADNVAYYQRFGYELIETLNPIEGAPTYYTMWRTPR